MKISHWYHLYLDGDARWLDIAVEYAQVLGLAGFPVSPSLGLVGAARDGALAWAEGQGWPVVAEADTGWEQVTLRALQAALPGMADDDAVLYTHAKGSWRNIALEDQWRRSMLWHLAYRWRDCVRLLEEFDTAGCHWQGDHYAGNFWWARAGYLKHLPPLQPAAAEADRFAAEMWLGLGNPARANLVEGFPPEGTEAGALALSELLPARYIRRRAVYPARPGPVRRRR